MAATLRLSGILFASFLLIWASIAIAEPVTLKTRSGGLEITGELISTDDKTITINTPIAGLMVLDKRNFDCHGVVCSALGAGDSFSIQGSNTIGAALMPSLIEAYAASKHLRVEKRFGATPEEIGLDLTSGAGAKLASIDLRSHGSGTAFPALMKGAAEIGASSRPIKTDEEKTLQDAGLDVNAYVLGLDGIIVLISPDNPVNDLSLDQIAGIFSGQITDWSQVGGPAGPVTVYARDENSGTTDSFASLVLAPRNLKFTVTAQRRESSSDLSDEVAQDRHAIGFAGFAYLRSAKALAIRNVCGIAYPPAQFYVKTEEYPLSRRLYLYTTNKASSPHAQALLDYALSDAAQPVIVNTGFIDQSFQALPFRQQPQRITSAFDEANDEFDLNSMKQLVTLIGKAQRLSATYRFEKGDYRLDLRARQDVARLARYLLTPEMQDKEVLLIGFADSSGPFAANLAMSQARAETARNAVLAASRNQIDPSKIVAKAFGEVMPVDCNSTPEGRAKNRRVEVWLRDRTTTPSATSSFGATPASHPKVPQLGRPVTAPRP